jgi:hypothetical protein
MRLDLDPASLPVEQIPATLCQLAALHSALAARLVAAPAPAPEADDGVWLDAKQVAQELNCSPKFVYRHAPTWPFAKKLGTRSYRFSQAGLRRWRTRQKA